MSRYTMRIRDNGNAKEHVTEAIYFLNNHDNLAIYTDNSSTKQEIVDVLSSQNFNYKHVKDGDDEYILAERG